MRDSWFQLALRSRAILRPARVRLPQNHVGDFRPRRHTLQLPGDLVVKILRHVFRRGIHALKGLQIVHELMIQPPQHLANNSLHLHKVHQQADRIELRPFHRNAYAVIMPVGILAFAFVAPQGVPCRERLFHADLKHFAPVVVPPVSEESWFCCFRRGLPSSPLSHLRSHPKTGPRPPIPASPGSAAATQEKSYHRASAEFACPAAPARRGRFSFESAARTPASAKAPLAEPEIPQRRCAHPPAMPPRATPQWGRWALQTAAGPQLRRTTALPERQRPARSWPCQTVLPRPCF